jgi:hypothetical protein
MKKLILIMSAILFIGVANGQSKMDEVDLIQSVFGMEKKAIVADFLIVKSAQQDAFWKIYEEYETARKDLGKKRIELLSQYADNYNSMSNETADSWMKDVLSLTKAADKLLVTYYKKVRKITDPVTALKFYHVENYILTSIRMAMLDKVPFVQARLVK